MTRPACPPGDLALGDQHHLCHPAAETAPSYPQAAGSSAPQSQPHGPFHTSHLVPPGLDGEGPGAATGAANDAGARAHRLARPQRTCPRPASGRSTPVALAGVTTAENIRATYRVRAAGPSATSEPGEAT